MKVKAQIKLIVSKLISHRRNGSILFLGTLDEKEHILKVGPTSIINFEEKQKQQLLQSGFKLPQTIEIREFDEKRIVLIEEYIKAPMLIEKILETLEGHCIDQKTSDMLIEYFKKLSYDNVTYTEQMDPFFDIDSLLKGVKKGELIAELYKKISAEMKITEHLVVSHGDLSPFNISQDLTLIDFEDVGHYPLGFDLISFFYSHLWFPKKDQGIEGHHQLYAISEKLDQQVLQLLSHIITNRNLNDTEIKKYKDQLIILRGIWHIVGAQDSLEFINWRVEKVLAMGESLQPLNERC